MAQEYVVNQATGTQDLLNAFIIYCWFIPALGNPSHDPRPCCATNCLGRLSHTSLAVFYSLFPSLPL